MSTKYGKCECCERELEEYEKDLLDCGHYACNSCTYSDRLQKAKTQCEKCRDKYDDQERAP